MNANEFKSIFFIRVYSRSFAVKLLLSSSVYSVPSVVNPNA